MALKLSVIGTGYLGATHAACMASLGFEVIGYDTETSKIELLSKGKVPFYEPDLEDLLAEQIKSGRLTFTTNINDLADADVHFICVGTPQIKGGNAADLKYVDSALEAIAKNQFMLPEKGEGFFRPIYIDDLVRGIAMASKHPDAAGEIFNLSCEGYMFTKDYFTPHYQWLGKKGPLAVSTKLALRISAMASKVADLMGNLNEASPSTVKQLSTKSWFSIKKAEHILGWKPEVTFEDGMKVTREWAQEQGLLGK